MSICNFYFTIADIATAKADVIVNAANGWGYMGGEKARKGLLSGVAESLNYATKGEMEAYTLQKARRFEKIPSFLFGKHCGEIFSSPAFGLNCYEVVHAVTVRSPGSRSNLKTICILANAVYTYCREKGHHTVAIPMLGAGTGGLDECEVEKIISKTAILFPELSVRIYSKTED